MYQRGRINRKKMLIIQRRERQVVDQDSLIDRRFQIPDHGQKDTGKKQGELVLKLEGQKQENLYMYPLKPFSLGCLISFLLSTHDYLCPLPFLQKPFPKHLQHLCEIHNMVPHEKPDIFTAVQRAFPRKELFLYNFEN